MSSCNAIDGIWHVLWTGCQWKPIEKEGFSFFNSVLHESFQTWQQQGVFKRLFKTIVIYYARECGIGWKWQSIDNTMSPAPFGGAKTGRNPTDSGKSGSKIHLLVDQISAPLAIWITVANEHNKWSADDLIVTEQSYSDQHFCADKVFVRRFPGSVEFDCETDNMKYNEKRTSRRMNVRYQVQKCSLLAAGLLSEPWVGWQSAAALLPVGASSRRTGSHSFTWLLQKSSSDQLSDRFKVHHTF